MSACVRLDVVTLPNPSDTQARPALPVGPGHPATARVHEPAAARVTWRRLRCYAAVMARPPERDRDSLSPAPGSPLSRIARLAGGGTLLAVGGALMILPGPGIPFVLAGLAVLGEDFDWPRKLLHR